MAAPIKLPRLPPNWQEQPAFFSRAWNDAMSGIETALATTQASVDSIKQILIDLNLASETATGALTLAQSAIAPDGTIKDDRVNTEALALQSVTKPYYTQLSADLPLPDGVETLVLSLSVVKDQTDSDVEITGLARMNSNKDFKGTFFIYRDSILIDAIPITALGSGTLYRLPVPLSYRDNVATAGPHMYKLTYKGEDPLSTVLAIARTNFQVVEVKR